jgi:membrane-anchored protein YejM (alkaline phosphatase superfamily)
MNSHSKLHNFMFLLFSVILLTSFILSFMWGHDAEQGILYVFSSTLCAGVLMALWELPLTPRQFPDSLLPFLSIKELRM